MGVLKITDTFWCNSNMLEQDVHDSRSSLSVGTPMKPPYRVTTVHLTDKTYVAATAYCWLFIGYAHRKRS